MSFGTTRSGWTRRDRLSGNNSPEFEVVKAGEVEVKPRFAQLADFEREHLEIPAGIERQLVVGEHIGAALRRREMRQDDARPHPQISNDVGFPQLERQNELRS